MELLLAKKHQQPTDICALPSVIANASLANHASREIGHDPGFDPLEIRRQMAFFLVQTHPWHGRPLPFLGLRFKQTASDDIGSCHVPADSDLVLSPRAGG